MSEPVDLGAIERTIESGFGGLNVDEARALLAALRAHRAALDRLVMASQVIAEDLQEDDPATQPWVAEFNVSIDAAQTVLATVTDPPGFAQKVTDAQEIRATEEVPGLLRDARVGSAGVSRRVGPESAASESPAQEMASNQVILGKADPPREGETR